MNELRFPIVGGDYESGGQASAAIKTILKRVGVEPEAVRRAMIALYEAEMNVVIHARRGEVRLRLLPGAVEAVIEDEGPGIADLGLAVTEGYSTAPPAARELGFGAGMGLPNIRRNSDRFNLDSTVGVGTRLDLTFRFRSAPRFALSHFAVAVRPERCNGCRRCLPACPTQALRVRGNRPQILEALCVDCAECVAHCRPGALALNTTAPGTPARQTTLATPRHFPWQFGARVASADVEAACAAAGYAEVRSLAEWEDALRLAVQAYADAEAKAWPVLSPLCPAVVNFIAVRFPSLLPLVAPFASPLEAAREALAGRPAAYAVDCPARFTAWMRDPANPFEALDNAPLRDRLRPHLPACRATASAAGAPAPDALRVTGWRQATALLEQIENGVFGGWRVVELFGCEGGCAGSPYFREVPAVADERDRRERPAGARQAAAIRLTEPRRPRPGLRLDDDMRRAMEKLAQLEALAKRLPGADCGQCGAPTCQALAEDIVLGRAALAACPFATSKGERP